MKVGNFFETRRLTPDEEEEYRKLKPGVYQMPDMIRMVVIDGCTMSVLEITQNMSLSTLRVDPE